jgi:tRNA nucleotidyltransferase/poly(A) polymerase
MYVQKNLAQHINEILYKYYTERFPYLKNHLPYKDPTVEQTEIILNMVKGTEAEVMLSDMLTLLTGKGECRSSEAINMLNRLSIKEAKVKIALNESSVTTQNLAFYLSRIDKDACIVGGCVRDSLMGATPKDWDFVTSAEYDTLKLALESAGFETDETGKQFLVLIVSKGGEQFEIARFRKDGMYLDGRHPDSVEAGTLKEDAERRDFTVNAMAKDENGEIIDLFNGKMDIDRMVLITPLPPEQTFNDDPLRILRAIRFAITKGFSLKFLDYYINNYDYEGKMGVVSSERIREELYKCFKHDTMDTLDTLNDYPTLKRYIFENKLMWLKPTMEQ